MKKITVKIKPTTFQQTYHFYQPPGTYYTFNNVGSGWVDMNYMYGIVREKHRKKVISRRKNVAGKTISKIEPAYWKISVYKFPKNLLEAIGMELIQKTRHFVLKQK
jgi:hypothetical protein